MADQRDRGTMRAGLAGACKISRHLRGLTPARRTGRWPERFPCGLGASARRANLWVPVKTNAVKPGEGGAFNQVELKNLIDARKLNERFRARETVETSDLELKDFSFLYAHGDTLIFMDLETYGQIELATDWIGERAAFDGMKVTLQMRGSPPVSIRFPPHMILTVVEADPAVRGQTAASSYKPAVLENGLRVLAPPLIDSGERIVVDTSEVTYMRRAD
jgi:elongation factor P